MGTHPSLVEKDYWIMHALWGLQRAGFEFELKGGTSLSKGWGLIHRFSEDIDIRIEPDRPLHLGRNHDKKAHRDERCAFFDDLAARISIPGFQRAERDTTFDDKPKYRSGGIRLIYPEINPLVDGVKSGILLETGFDDTAPNTPRRITSWAYNKAADSGTEGIVDNRAVGVACYHPGYTLVEKLQTILTKFDQYEEYGKVPIQFLRHYYDVYCLLGSNDVQSFIGTDQYHAHVKKRFPRKHYGVTFARCEAFLLANEDHRTTFERDFEKTRGLYYQGQPSLDEILGRIGENLKRLQSP